MRLPPRSAHFRHRVRCGGYVERRLRRAKYTELADSVAAATNDVLVYGRGLEDHETAVQCALADRDGADDDLDDTAQDARAALAGRGADAVKKAPYKLIFPQGIGYYTAATLTEETKRYGELKDRLEEHLPGADEVRVKAVPAIEAGIVAFTAGSEQLGKARTNEALARTRLDAAEEAWERLLTKVYGLLIADLGRAAAERFFPKYKVRKDEDDDPTG
ncbi:hypothetical protein [Polyangium spumosum]|uniref:Uncharacterized protein n=1 Tax=Polyangium spumosum TaxID=889282 RepID=A0A6N7Q2Y4_9BACT|nr:hypothetical protein [Polyangium spumosum]MRG97566.1 hypothetical protein [Polyangium spumosum]